MHARSRTPLARSPLPLAVALSLSLTSFAATPARAARPAAGALSCGKLAAPDRAAVRDKGDPAARAAAQRGLDYLARASEAWTQSHRCFGCHVQAVTVDAMAVGRHHQYDVKDADVAQMEAALMLGLTAGGRKTGSAFQGQAWARYDQWINQQHTKDLLTYAQELIQYQQQDGSVADDDGRLPVTGGTMHTTFQSMQTWRQAYARTADEKWLAPMRKAERYLAAQSAGWGKKGDGEAYLQNVNFALLGLIAAGVGPSEPSARTLQSALFARQNQDGGWGLDKAKSDALATGQTLYALKLAGHPDSDGRIARGMRWLSTHQDKDGAWRTVRSGQGGAEKGEGMWAVLGLVSVDVMSLAVSGLVDGQHVDATMKLRVDARDNQSGAVAKVELFVDDLPLKGECAASVALDWDTRALAEGKHILDVVATNQKGQESRRRFQVYAGNVFLTEVGARFDEQRQVTEVTARDIAPAESAGRIELNVFAVEGANNKRGKKVFTSDQKGAPGALTFTWNGSGSDGKPQPRGRYLAELVLRDAKGKPLHTQSTLFFHDSEAAQRASFGEVEGRLSLQGGGGTGTAANTVVELVDDKGNVVQTVRSTDQGNYRFKSVTAGKYRVRAKKEGWSAREAAVTASPAEAPAKADIAF